MVYFSICLTDVHIFRQLCKSKLHTDNIKCSDLLSNNLNQEIIIMNNKRLVPEAKEAMDKFKMEAAQVMLMYPVHIKENIILITDLIKNWRTEKKISTPFFSYNYNVY